MVKISNSSIWTRDRIQSEANTPIQNGPGSDVNEGIPCILQTPALLELHNQIVLYQIKDTRCSGVLPLWRDTVGVFYNLGQLGFISIGQERLKINNCVQRNNYY